MTDEEFWTLIERTDEEAGHDEEVQGELLAKELAKLPPAEIISFGERLNLHAAALYDDRLYAVGSILRDMDDDEFWIFRYWLVARGRKVIGKFRDDPDSLADVLQFTDHEPGRPIGGAPWRAYKEVTGEDDFWNHVPDVDRPENLLNPIGWAPEGFPDEERLQELLPRVWEKFSNRQL